jgi:hypothetical protein
VGHRPSEFGPPGDEPQTLSTVRSAESGGWKHSPLRIEPEAGQVTEDVSESASNETWDVLHEHEARSKRANGTCEGRPEPARVGLGEPAACSRDGLTREAPGEEVDPLGIVGELSSIVVAGAPEPLAPEGVAPLVDLAPPADVPPGPLEAEVEETDAGEEGCGRRGIR